MTDITSKLIAAFGVEDDRLGAIDCKTLYTAAEESKHIEGGPWVMRKGQKEDSILVGYLADDHDSPYSWDNEALGTFLKFGKLRGAAEKAQQAAKDAREEGKLVLTIKRYDRGSVHYRVLDADNHAGWFLRPVVCDGFFIPCDAQQERYRQTVNDASSLSKAERKAALKQVIDQIIDETNKILDDYSNWCNGEVYGAIVEEWTFDRSRNCFNRTGVEEIWNCIGTDRAEEALLKETCLATAPALDPAEPAPAP